MLLGGTPVRVLTCPPLDVETFPYERLFRADLVYLRLHGIPDQPYLYGDDWLTALSVERLRKIEKTLAWDGIVFMEGCFGALTGMPEVFLALGAAAVVASEEETDNRTLSIGPAGKFGLRFVKKLLAGETVSAAYEKARIASPQSVGRAFRLFGDQKAKLKKRRKK